MAFPIAKTVAIKDACDHFGKLFGSDLNRKDDVVYRDPQTLVPFERGHDKWGKAVESIAKKLVTIDQTAKKYNLTDQGKAQLQEDVAVTIAQPWLARVWQLLLFRAHWTKAQPATKVRADFRQLQASLHQC